jgi:hypothetical protein
MLLLLVFIYIPNTSTSPLFFYMFIKQGIHTFPELLWCYGIILRHFDTSFESISQWQYNAFLSFFFFKFLIYSYVHTIFGSFLPPSPTPCFTSPPYTPLPLATRQTLFCPYLYFCWRESISNNRKEQRFLLVEIRIAIQGVYSNWFPVHVCYLLS